MEKLIKTNFNDNDYLTEYSIKFKKDKTIDNDRKTFIFNNKFDILMKVVENIIPKDIINIIFALPKPKQIIIGCNKDNSIIKIYRFQKNNNIGFTIEKDKIKMKKYISYENSFIEEDIQKEMSICKHQKVRVPYKNDMFIYYIGYEINGDLTIYYSKPNPNFGRK